MNKYERVPVWHVNGNGKLEPVDGPTAVETPAAKHDVEALLEEAARHTVGAKAPWSAAGVIERLAAALRAERERADAMTEKSCKDWENRRIARSHLRAVLEFMWPGDTGGPTVVQKARAFLAGDEQVPQRDHEWRTRWVAEREEHNRTRAQLATEDEAHAHTRAQSKHWQTEAEVSRKHCQAASAAQNRAESEAAGLRAQLTDLETAIRAIVDRVEKGRA